MFDTIQVDPVLTHPDIFENGDFSLRFGFLPSVHTAVNGVFGHQKRRFSKTVPRVAYRFFVWNDRKRRFLNTMMSYIVAAKETK